MKKFVIVDSSADTCERLRANFESLGFEAYNARSTSEAIVIVRERNPDYVILDLSVPGLPIRQFVKETREQCPACKIVLASTSIVLQERATHLTADGFIKRPYTAEQIVELFSLVKATTFNGS